MGDIVRASFVDNQRLPLTLPKGARFHVQGDMLYDHAMNVKTTPSGRRVVSGPHGYGSSFDGTDDYISCGNSAALQGSQNTIVVWCKTSAPGASFRDVFVKSLAYGIWMNDSEFGVYDWGDSTWKGSGVNVADGVAHRLVVVRNLNVVNGSFLYVDGTLKATITYKSNTHTTSLFVGGYKTTPGENWGGIVYEATVCSLLWTPADVLEDFNNNAWRYNATR